MAEKMMCTILILLCMQSALAGQSDEITELRAQVAELTRRLDMLESRERSLDQGAIASKQRVAAGPTAAGEKVRFLGDFRYRYEEIDLQGANIHTRTRLRARAGLLSKISDTVELGFGLSSGGSFPTSSTQTLGDGGSKKQVALDLAYVDWAPVEGLQILAGKFPNPLLRAPGYSMMWDDEWRPEGMALTYRNETIFVALLSTWLESDSRSPAREQSYGGQIGLRRAIGGTELTTGIGYFNISVAGKGTLYGPNLAFAGNSFHCSDPQDTGSCLYAHDYREVDLFAALDFDVRNLRVGVYGHILRNLGADEFGIGWTAGAKATTILRDQVVQFDYFYRVLEADAVFGQLSDSDFGGGGSDVRGHYFKAGWTVTPRWMLSVTYFANRIGSNANVERDYNRVQLNADFSY